MEFHSLATNFRAHYKKLLLLGTASLTVYLLKKYMDKRKRAKSVKPGKKKIKEFPTIEEIQKFIEDLPFDAVNTDKTISLKDLLGELSEFSEDEEWKELIQSVHTMYEDNNAVKLLDDVDEETGSIMSIYEDPNLITLHGEPPKEIDKVLNDNGCDKETTKLSTEEGKGDTKTVEPSEEKKAPNDFEMLRSTGSGDKIEIVEKDVS